MNKFCSVPKICIDTRLIISLLKLVLHINIIPTPSFVRKVLLDCSPNNGESHMLTCRNNAVVQIQPALQASSQCDILAASPLLCHISNWKYQSMMPLNVSRAMGSST